MAASQQILQDEKEYLVGLLPNGPYYCTTFCGISFPLITELIDVSADGVTTTRMPQIGERIFLSDEKVKEIKKKVDSKVVVWFTEEKTGKRITARVYDKTDRRSRDKNAEPLSKYVYIASIEQLSKSNINWRSDYPPSLHDVENSKDSKK